MKCLSLLLVLCLASCASSRSNIPCAAKDWLDASVESHLADIGDIKTRYLKIVDLQSVPVAARAGVVEWIDNEVNKLAAQQKAGDQLWYFREEKCPGCHWYREGFALVRGCEIVDTVTLNDDM
jgi:hypothetical protein